MSSLNASSLDAMSAELERAMHTEREMSAQQPISKLMSKVQGAVKVSDGSSLQSASIRLRDRVAYMATQRDRLALTVQALTGGASFPANGSDHPATSGFLPTIHELLSEANGISEDIDMLLATIESAVGSVVSRT